MDKGKAQLGPVESPPKRKPRRDPNSVSAQRKRNGFYRLTEKKNKDKGKAKAIEPPVVNPPVVDAEDDSSFKLGLAEHQIKQLHSEVRSCQNELRDEREEKAALQLSYARATEEIRALRERCALLERAWTPDVVCQRFSTVVAQAIVREGNAEATKAGRHGVLMQGVKSLHPDRFSIFPWMRLLCTQVCQQVNEADQA